MDAAGLHLSTLDRRDGVLLCRGCGRGHPVIDEIPIVLRDLGPWAASEGADALRRRDLPEAVTEALLPADGVGARNRRLARLYSEGVEGDFAPWLAERIAGATGPILELGAGRGHSGTTRLDTNLELLRQRAAPALIEGAQGVRLAVGGAVVADAADPPFAPGAFATVVLANLLDSCPDPFLVLAQADALTAPGGCLLASCPYAFKDDITPPSHRFDETALIAALDGRAHFGPYALDARLVEVRDDLRWTLRTAPRAAHEHRVQVVIARKPSE